MRSKNKFYQKWWFWLLCVFGIGGVLNLLDKPKEIDAFRDKIRSVNLSDTISALTALDSLYRKDFVFRTDAEYLALKDSIKSLMILLGKDPDYVAPKIVTKESKLLKSLSSWDGSLPPFVEIIKNNMNDPESFDHVNTYYLQSKKDSSDFIITMVYRGKNAFGAKIKGSNSCVYNVDTKQIKNIE
ncbi:hypothetical protein [Sphingobacterium sp.]|uniref:hypothetical protein n=1 Tax=Sphingobacterium sp. TaxID=341027 RepID=UPI0028A10C03|nr:hypothetical protein [Sphingobacterium sp.]